MMKLQNTKRIKRKSFYIEGVYKEAGAVGRAAYVKRKRASNFSRVFKSLRKNYFFLTICA